MYESSVLTADNCQLKGYLWDSDEDVTEILLASVREAVAEGIKQENIDCVRVWYYDNTITDECLGEWRDGVVELFEYDAVDTK